jgi:hypothetical protein
MRAFLPGLTALGLVAASGCHSVGPGTVPRDRLDYSDSISDSWKSQLLKNIVKLRYLDTPVFVDVSQIVSGYTLETGISVNGQFSPASMRGDTFAGMGASGTFTDRPTITYTPLTGNKFLRGLLDPVPPRSVFYLAHAGYNVRMILELCVDSLGGLRNRSVRSGRVNAADPEFIRATELLTQLQEAGSLGLRLNDGTNENRSAYLVFQDNHLSDEGRAQMMELKRLLSLDSDQSRFLLVYSPIQTAPGELAVGSRSLIQMMIAMASFVDVPTEDVARRRTVEVPGLDAWAEPPFHIHCSTSKPTDAFVAVTYRDRWFWVDDGDLASKRTLSALLFLFTLSETGVIERLPVLTIPAG